MRVVLFGLDGMTLKVLLPYMEAGLLPNFARVFSGGSSGILRSTIPFYTGPGWTSIATGKNPGKHCIFGFWKRKGYKTELVTKNNSALAEPVWSILSRKGKRVTVLNVPFTYPPDKVNGVMVSGFMTPSVGIDKDVEFAYPREMRDEIFEIIPDYQIAVKLARLMFYGNRDSVLEEAFKITRHCGKLMEHLLKRQDWDFFYVCFTGTDRVQHFLWDKVISKDRRCVQYYKYLDDTLGHVLKKIDDGTALFIVSDHGFRRAEKGFHINNFLKELGLLETRGDIKRGITRNIGRRIALTDFSRMIWRFVKRLVPMWLRRYVVMKIVKKHSSGDEIDWTRTKAFSLLGEGPVSINLKDREPGGIVEKQDYEELCRFVKEKLLEFKDPDTGRSVIREVYIGREIYSPLGGDPVPDLVAVADDGYTIRQEIGGSVISGNRLGSLYFNGDHEREGIIAAYGKSIGKKNIDVSVYDVMPTILYLMGVPIPEDVDGRVLTEMIDPDFVTKNEIIFEKPETFVSSEVSTLKDTESEAVERHLKNLGYLD